MAKFIQFEIVIENNVRFLVLTFKMQKEFLNTFFFLDTEIPIYDQKVQNTLSESSMYCTNYR